MPAPENPWENLFWGRCLYIQGVQRIQFLMRNPIFRSRMSNAGARGQTHVKSKFERVLAFNILVSLAPLQDF